MDNDGLHDGGIEGGALARLMKPRILDQKKWRQGREEILVGRERRPAAGNCRRGHLAVSRSKSILMDQAMGHKAREKGRGTPRPPPARCIPRRDKKPDGCMLTSSGTLWFHGPLPILDLELHADMEGDGVDVIGAIVEPTIARVDHDGILDRLRGQDVGRPPLSSSRTMSTMRLPVRSDIWRARVRDAGIAAEA